MKQQLKRKMQIRFVLLAMAVLLVMQAGIIFFSARTNYKDMEKKADLILSQIYANKETGAAYFSVVVHPGKSVIRLDKSQNVTIHQEDAVRLAKFVLESGEQRGFAEGYRYQVNRNEDGMRIVFLSRTASMEMYKEGVRTLVWNSLGGLTIMCVFLVVSSSWIVEPLVRNHRKQKEFITSASHGLKTPLTVIMADAQILEMELGENSWLEDIQQQSRYLTQMTEHLVALAKAEEVSEQSVFTEFNVSELAEEVLDSYEALAKRSNKQLKAEIAKGVFCRGDEPAIHQLIVILLDNAFKYCPEGGSVECTLSKKKQGLQFEVRNTTGEISEEQLQRFTDRFYRGGNTKGVKGFGLGLSIAEAIVNNHKGTMEISRTEENQVRIFIALK